MDWMERQTPPPSWHDEGEIFKDLSEEFCPLTSVVRKCYLNHLKQTLLQNYNLYKSQTILESTLQDIILHWEQNALRACMMTAVYQKAMRQLINAIKDDTKKNKLTSVLTTNIKRSLRQNLSDASTQTESSTSPPEAKVKRRTTVNGFESKNGLKRDHSVNRESSDGPFLTPPSDYPLPTHTAKKVARRQLPFPPQDVPTEVHPPFENPSPHVPFHFNVPPPNYPFVPQQLHHEQYTNWPVNTGPMKHEDYPVQPISVITNACTESQYEVPPDFSASEPPNQISSSQSTVEVEAAVENLFRDVSPGVEFPFGPCDATEPDYDFDQIEEEMARLYGQAFSEDDGKAMSDETDPEPEFRPIVPPIAPVKEEDKVDLDLLCALHETQLQARLEYIRKNWSLERQAKLKRRFIELFGREDDEDQLSQVTPKEAAKCRQRIAPWIVNHLMPLYKEKRIASRHLFKSLARHISDLLIQRNLYPDECDVWMGVQEFFRGGTIIQCEADFSS